MTALLMAVGVVLGAAGCTGDDPAKRNPCDPANRTQDILDHAVKTFHIALPPDAADVSFATIEGWQAYKATLLFRTTPQGLRDFHADSTIPAAVPAAAPARGPQSAGGPLRAGQPTCELDRDFTYSAVVADDSTYADLERSMAVDTTHPEAPRVLVVARVR